MPLAGAKGHEAVYNYTIMPKPPGGNKFLTVGLPLIAFVLVGVSGLDTFVKGQNAERDRRVRRLGQKQFDIQEEYEKTLKKMRGFGGKGEGRIAEYEPVAIPRNTSTTPRAK